jgi:hypothetical protein
LAVGWGVSASQDSVLLTVGGLACGDDTS